MTKYVCKPLKETPVYLLLGVLKSVMRYFLASILGVKMLKFFRQGTIALANPLFLDFKHQSELVEVSLVYTIFS